MSRFPDPLVAARGCVRLPVRAPCDFIPLSILSLCVSCPVCAHPCLLAHSSSPILPVLPLTLTTLFSRLCLSACTCHGSLLGTTQTACSAHSPARCFPRAGGASTSAGPVIQSVCLMCLASVHSPSARLQPDTSSASLPLSCLIGRWLNSVFPLHCSFLF